MNILGLISQLIGIKTLRLTLSLRASHPISSVDLQGNTARWLGLLYLGDGVQNYTRKFHRRRVSSQESDLVRTSTPPPLIGNIIWCKL